MSDGHAIEHAGIDSTEALVARVHDLRDLGEAKALIGQHYRRLAAQLPDQGAVLREMLEQELAGWKDIDTLDCARQAFEQIISQRSATAPVETTSEKSEINSDVDPIAHADGIIEDLPDLTAVPKTEAERRIVEELRREWVGFVATLDMDAQVKARQNAHWHLMMHVLPKDADVNGVIRRARRGDRPEALPPPGAERVATETRPEPEVDVREVDGYRFRPTTPFTEVSAALEENATRVRSLDEAGRQSARQEWVWALKIVSAVSSPAKLVDAYFAAPRRQLQQPESESAAAEPTSDDPRPLIQITTEEHDVTARSLSLIEGDPSIYQHAGQLSRVARDLWKAAAPNGKPLPVQRPPDAPRILPFTPALLSELLTTVVRYEVFKPTPSEPDRYVRAHPPGFTIKALLDRGSWSGIRPLDGIVEAPQLRPDGSVLQVRGYDPATRLLYEPTTDYLAVPESPSRDDARAAASELMEIFCDFPLADEHKAVCVAGLLTLFARAAVDGPTPLFALDAPTPGSGKTLAADAIAVVATGRKFARTPNSGDDDEWKKKITSIALAGDRMMLIDNVSTPLGSQSLDVVLTGCDWKERLLGTNDSPSMRITTVWFASGNNIEASGDLFRRMLFARFRPSTEHPEDRQDSEFKHPSLLTWIRDERRRLVKAALVVLRSYCAAGKPDMGVPRWGSFEEWTRLVAHACVWAGLSDPLATRALVDPSPARSAFRSLVIGLHEMNIGIEGLTVREILAKMDREEKTAEDRAAQERADGIETGHWHPPHQALRAALDELAPAQPGRPYDPRRVGKQLEKFKDGVVHLAANGAQKALDLRIVRGKNAREGAARWLVKAVPSAGSAGSEGSVSPSHAGARSRAHARTAIGPERSQHSQHSQQPPVEPEQHPDAVAALDAVNHVGELGENAAQADVDRLLSLAQASYRRQLDAGALSIADTLRQYVREALERVTWLSDEERRAADNRVFLETKRAWLQTPRAAQ